MADAAVTPLLAACMSGDELGEPPNNTFDGTAGSHSLAAASQRERSASRGVAHETSARGVHAMAAHDPASGEVAKGPGVPHAGDSAMAKHRSICDPASR